MRAKEEEYKRLTAEGATHQAEQMKLMLDNIQEDKKRQEKQQELQMEQFKVMKHLINCEFFYTIMLRFVHL